MKIIFNTKECNEVISKFKYKMESLIPNNDFESGRNRVIITVLESMEKSPSQWDDFCQINIGWIGNQFLHALAFSEKDSNKEKIDDICSMCFRFLFEMYLSIKNDLSIEFESAKKFIFTNIESFEQGAKAQIEYTIRDMPISIFKAVANSDAIENIKDFNSNAKKFETLKAQWTSDLSSMENRVNLIKDSLSKYENAFNFVGLYQGFDELAESKKIEKDGILLWLRFLSFLIILPIIGELYFIYTHLENITLIKDGLLVSVFPTVSLVAISIYYFRVLLFNYKSVKSQLLQIDLRKTLCRFIQSYSDYACKIKSKDSGSLEKFESVIFSGIVTDDGNLPSTFDGMDQISKLLKAVKS